MTRTYVQYFGGDKVAKLEELVEELNLDLVRRSEYIPADLYNEGRDRIEAVRLTVKRLTDRVID